MAHLRRYFSPYRRKCACHSCRSRYYHLATTEKQCQENELSIEAGAEAVPEPQPMIYHATMCAGGRRYGRPCSKRPGQWRDYNVRSVDNNFIVSRIVVARYAKLDRTLLLRLHVRGSLQHDDTALTLTLPDAVRVSKHQFSPVLVRSTDCFTFAPMSVSEDGTTIVISHRLFEKDKMYEISCQTVLEGDW